MKRTFYEALFNPSSVALFGASDRTPSLGHTVYQAMIAAQPAFPLYAINPHHKKIAEHHCYSSLAEVKQEVELAVITTPLKTLIDILRTCGRHGVKAALIITPAYENDKDSQDKIALKLNAIAKKYNIKLIGPNCFGVLRPVSHFTAWMGTVAPKPGTLGLISESGNVCSSLIGLARQQDIGFSQVITLGNTAGVDIGDMLDYLTNDSSTSIILLYIEHIRPARKLLSSLRAAARIKPVILLTAQPNSDRLHNSVINAALRRAGVIRAYRLNDLFRAANILLKGKRLTTDGLGIISNSQGLSSIAAQRATNMRIPLYQPSTECVQELTHLLPLSSDIGNPCNIFHDFDATYFKAALTTMLSDADCGAILIMISISGINNVDAIADVCLEIHKQQRKPIMACFMGGDGVTALLKKMDTEGIPCSKTPESAIESYSFLLNFFRNQCLLIETPNSNAFENKANVERAHALINDTKKAGEERASPNTIRKVLKCFHIEQNDIVKQLQYRGVPLRIEIKRDIDFGPAIHIYIAETNIKVCSLLPPLNEHLLHRVFRRIQRPESEYLDHAPLEQLILQLSDLACEIAELETLTLSSEHTNDDQRQADIAITFNFSRHIEHAYEHLAFAPYPVHLSTTYTTKDGGFVRIRPVRAEDADMSQKFVAKLSEEARVMRFMQNLKQLPPLWLARFTQIDYDREMALIALADEGDDVIEVGVVRYSNIDNDGSCEFAVVIADEWQGQGLARHLMESIINIARDAGFIRMTGVILAENNKMKSFCKNLGFTITNDPDDFNLVNASLVLNPSADSD